MIIQLEEAKRTLEDFRANIVDLGAALKIDKLKSDITEQEAKTQAAIR